MINIDDKIEELTWQLNMYKWLMELNGFPVDKLTILFIFKDYNSYKGNAYGLANTLTQTAFMRPKIKSKKVNNLFFTGQLTVPGPGVPPALISGKIAAESILKQLRP